MLWLPSQIIRKDILNWPENCVFASYFYKKEPKFKVPSYSILPNFNLIFQTEWDLDFRVSYQFYFFEKILKSEDLTKALDYICNLCEIKTNLKTSEKLTTSVNTQFSNSSQDAVSGTKKKPRCAKSALCELLLDLMEKPRNIEVLAV